MYPRDREEHSSSSFRGTRVNERRSRLETLIFIRQLLGYLILGTFLTFFAVQLTLGLIGTALAIIDKVKEKLEK